MLIFKAAKFFLLRKIVMQTFCLSFFIIIWTYLSLKLIISKHEAFNNHIVCYQWIWFCPLKKKIFLLFLLCINSIVQFSRAWLPLIWKALAPKFDFISKDECVDKKKHSRWSGFAYFSKMKWIQALLNGQVIRKWGFIFPILLGRMKFKSKGKWKLTQKTCDDSGKNVKFTIHWQ